MYAWSGPGSGSVYTNSTCDCFHVHGMVRSVDPRSIDFEKYWNVLTDIPEPEDVIVACDTS